MDNIQKIKKALKELSQYIGKRLTFEEVDDIVDEIDNIDNIYAYKEYMSVYLDMFRLYYVTMIDDEEVTVGAVNYIPNSRSEEDATEIEIVSVEIWE